MALEKTFDGKPYAGVLPAARPAILYNNMTCPKKINWVQDSMHGYVPPDPNQNFSPEAK